MILRLILISVFIYLSIKFIKLLFFSPPQVKQPPQSGPSGPVNEMVQDPVCKVYIPKNSSLSLNISGTTYYFCSRECMDKFRSEN